MARIRTIKPEMFTSATVTSLSLPARWTFVGLLTHVDDEGRCKADARLVKAAIWPLEDDMSWREVESCLDELIAAGLVCRYGVGLMHVVSFTEHQRVSKPSASKFAPCEREHGALPEPSTTPTGSLPEPSGSPTGALPVGREGNREAEVEVDRVAAQAPRATETASQALIGEWIDHCSGGRPPGRVVGQVAREIGKMLDEGIPVDDVRKGLATWHSKGLNPSVLASVVHEVRTTADRRSTKPSTTDERVAATLDLAARYAVAEGATLPAIGA